ncbi:Kanadaptin [Tupaia chinensis]|uniref:Kanadaptin n=1 Tax=Tupaia chinensis TaxID=246437 RepID=L8Y4D0_TUPCH|nr:Kanadaptin [Tupaia chinensis]
MKRKKTEDGSSKLEQEVEPEAAVQEASPPTDLMCSEATWNHENVSQPSRTGRNKDSQEMSQMPSSREEPSVWKTEHEKSRDESKRKKAPGPSKPSLALSSKYPEDDPDYCVWVPPEGQNGDGRTHLNDKCGY